MNDIRKIIISNGWDPDQNNALAEVVIPSTIETLNAPRKVTFLGQTLNWIPSNISTLQELEAPNITTFAIQNLLSGYTSLQTVTFNGLQYIVDSMTTANSQNGIFSGCNNLKTVNMLELIEINLTATRSQDSKICGTFGGCVSLQNLNVPKLKRTTYSKGTWSNYDGIFYNCVSLENVDLPSIEFLAERTFNNCTGLKYVTLGSEGNPVTAINSNTFYNCTQSGLTITIYTTGGAALAGEPWGATNADIEYEEA